MGSAIHPLTGPLEKLRRAESILQTLGDQLRDFEKSHRVEIVVAEKEPCGNYYALRARVSATPPTAWGAMIGDFLHNLRSSLDGFMWQLIILNGSDPTTFKKPLPAYPIFLEHKTQTGSGWWNEGRAQVKRIDPKHAEFIESTQPFRAPNPSRSALWVLHELNNSDKHRLIPLVNVIQSVALGIMSNNERHRQLMASGVEFSPSAPLTDGARFGKVHRRVLEECEPKYWPLTHLAFEDGIVRGLTVIEVLVPIFDTVHRILWSFRGVFTAIPPCLTEGLRLPIVLNRDAIPTGGKRITVEGKYINVPDISSFGPPPSAGP